MTAHNGQWWTKCTAYDNHLVRGTHQLYITSDDNALSGLSMQIVSLMLRIDSMYCLIWYNCLVLSIAANGQTCPGTVQTSHCCLLQAPALMRGN